MRKLVRSLGLAALVAASSNGDNGLNVNAAEQKNYDWAARFAFKVVDEHGNEIKSSRAGKNYTLQVILDVPENSEYLGVYGFSANFIVPEGVVLTGAVPLENGTYGPEDPFYGEVIDHNRIEVKRAWIIENGRAKRVVLGDANRTVVGDFPRQGIENIEGPVAMYNFITTTNADFRNVKFKFNKIVVARDVEGVGTVEPKTVQMPYSVAVVGNNNPKGVYISAETSNGDLEHELPGNNPLLNISVWNGAGQNYVLERAERVKGPWTQVDSWSFGGSDTKVNTVSVRDVAAGARGNNSFYRVNVEGYSSNEDPQQDE